MSHTLWKMNWREIGNFSSGKLNETNLRDDLIIKSIKLIYRYCEDSIKIHLKSDDNQLIVEGISRDRVSLAKFSYRLPFQVTRDACYLMDIDDYLAGNYLHVYRDRIDTDLPLNKCDSEFTIKLTNIDKELKITLRMIPNEVAKMLRVLRDRTYIFQLRVDGYRVFLSSSDDGGSWIELSRYVRPLRYVKAEFRYPLKWVSKALMIFPYNSYVDVHLAEARPMKIIFIDSPRKKLYVYIAPLVED